MNELSLDQRISSQRNKSFIVQTRVDARTVADFLHFFVNEKTEPILSKSQLIRLALETFHQVLVHEGMIKEPFEGTMDALAYLQSAGVGGLEDMNERMRRRLFSQLKLEEYQFEGGHAPPRTRTKSAAREQVDASAKSMAAELDIEMFDHNCEKCEELHSVTEPYLAEHGNVCLGCRLKEAG